MPLSLLFILTFILYAIYGQSEDDRTATIGYNGMIGSAHHLATESGLEILRNGGNAADAALAVQMTLNLVQPMMSGIGGGCFIIYYDYENKEIYAIDGREEAPNAYHSKIFCKNPACFNDPNDPECDCHFANQTAGYHEKRIGGLSTGVPGTLYAFYNLYKYFGSKVDIKWEDLLEPARKLAINGFPMYREMFDYLNDSESCMRKFNDTRKVFYEDINGDGTEYAPVNISQNFTNPDFAALLTEFQERGPNGSIKWFYNEDLAQKIVEAVTSVQHENEWEYENETVYRPGLMSLDDINGYRSVFRKVVESEFGDPNSIDSEIYKKFWCH